MTEDFKKIAAVTFTLLALTVPSLAHADRGPDDRRFDHRNDRVERRWDHNDRYSHDRYDRDRRHYSQRNYYYPAQRNVVVVNRYTPYDYPVEYRTYSGSRTVIYGDGNYVPLQSGGSYFYYGH